MRREATLMISVVLCACAAHGAEISWLSAQSGEFTNNLSWAGGVTPGLTDGGIFDVPGGFSVTLNSDAEAGYVAIDGSSPVFQFGSSRLDLTFISSPPAALTVGRSDGVASSLLLVSGTLAGHTMIVARDAGSTGSMTIGGATSVLEIPARLDVGAGGEGSIDVLGGGLIDCGQILMGRESGGQGRVTLSGAGSMLDATFVTVGEVSGATFEVMDGASAVLNGLCVGDGPGDGVVTLSGAASEIDTGPGNAIIGDGGDATLNFSQGTMRGNNLVFARGSGDVNATISSGLFDYSGDVLVGDGGSTDITFGAAHITICNRLRVASGNNSLATLRLDGNLGATLRVDIAPGAFSLGTIDLGPAATLSAPLVRLFSGGTLSGGGSVAGDIEASGAIEPRGVMSVTGDVGFAGIVGDGALLFEAGNTPSTLDVDGTATLTGTFVLTVADGFTPATDQSFVALRADAIVGDFASYDFPGDDWTASIVGNEIIATFTGVATDPEDLDGDGVVGAGDLAILLASWGSCGGCAADLTGDGVVSALDLATLLAAWG